MSQTTTLRLPALHPAVLLLAGLIAGLLCTTLARSLLRDAHADAPPPSVASLAATGAMPSQLAPARQAAARALGFAVTIEGNGVYGSGVLISPREGLVLTAAHVVSEMKSPMVSFHDGAAAVTARLLDSDATLDVALLEIAPQTRPAPVVGDPLLLGPGDEVMAVGCPRRLPFSVSRGIVSYVGRFMDGARWLQTDLPINDGNSGGPVVDREGHLVGITSFILRRAQGLSFALPISYAVERFPRLASLESPDERARFKAWHQ